jgi:hypothetical protein
MGGLSQAAIQGSPVRDWALTTTRFELIGGAACLVLCLAAVALAVWRPALRRRSS